MLHVPIGTQVVLRGAGSSPHGNGGGVGVVVGHPAGDSEMYEVQLVEGSVVRAARDEFRIRKESYAEDFLSGSQHLNCETLFEFVILRCTVGSRAYGLETEASDVDRRGVYLPPADLHWSLVGAPSQIERRDTDECYWELEKFLTLALKANPNILECLFTPLIDEATDLGSELLSIREAFLSKFAYRTYNGYVISQFKRLEQDLRNLGDLRWKPAMHLVRLLLCGIGLLREGRLEVSVGEHRDRLLAIKHGDWEWREVDAWRLELHRDFEREHLRSRLPEAPDFGVANRFLLRARRYATALEFHQP